MIRISRYLIRFRWYVLVSWVIVLGMAVVMIYHQPDHLTGGGFEVPGSGSLYVHHQLEQQFPDQTASPLALVAEPHPGATLQQMQEAVDFLRQVAARTAHVRVVDPPRQRPLSADHPYVLSLQLDFHNSGAVDIAKKLRKQLGVHGDDPGQVADQSVNVYVIGQGALGAAASSKTKRDIATAERWNFPIVLVVLLAVFGSLTAAIIPLVFGIMTVITSMGVVHFLSIYTTISVFVTPTVSMFGIALAVDYSLFILMRYREELATGQSESHSIELAMGTSGLAVLLSGLTVVASLTGIYLINTPVLRSMATGAIVAVSVAVLTALTLTPLVLTWFGTNVAHHSVWLTRLQPSLEHQSRFWLAWTTTIMRRPWVTSLAASSVLLMMAVPSVWLHMGNSMLHQFSPSHEIRRGSAAAGQALGPGALGPIRILVSFPDHNAPQQRPLLHAIDQTARQAPHVIGVSPVVFSQDRRSALLSATLDIDPEEMTARETITWLRIHLPQQVNPKQVHINIGGPTALIKDFDDQVIHTVPAVLVFVTVIAFVMLLISIRSVFLAFKGVVMTVLSVASAYGALVVVFQWGWLSWLGLHPTHSIDSFIPPIILAMTFGLSMDYEIFLLTRVRERFWHCHDTRQAVAQATTTSARTITSAALIMVAVFIGFACAGMPLVSELGIACAVAIGVDATIVRLILVPALMATFPQWNWWLPSRLARLLPSIDFHHLSSDSSSKDSVSP